MSFYLLENLLHTDIFREVTEFSLLKQMLQLIVFISWLNLYPLRLDLLQLFSYGCWNQTLY